MENNGAEFSTKYIAHYGLRTKNLAKMIEWYKNFFDARIQFDMDVGVFMTFDNDHHRLVIFTEDDIVDKTATTAGVDHIGIGLPDFAALVENYERLKTNGIGPSLAVNHGFTTSLYYDDPDGNQIELTVDNFLTKAECGDWVRSEKMAEVMKPPYFGEVFDANDLAQMFHAGASHSELSVVGLK